MRLSTFICFYAFSIISSVSFGAEDTQLDQTPHIRTLAASCAACHGTQGNSTGITPSLAGLDSAYFKTQMLAFKNGGRDSTVMHHHAKGLNEDEINQLAAYFAMQKPVAHARLKTQPLNAHHD